MLSEGKVIIFLKESRIEFHNTILDFAILAIFVTDLKILILSYLLEKFPEIIIYQKIQKLYYLVEI